MGFQPAARQIEDACGEFWRWLTVAGQDKRHLCMIRLAHAGLIGLLAASTNMVQRQE